MLNLKAENGVIRMRKNSLVYLASYGGGKKTYYNESTNLLLIGKERYLNEIRAYFCLQAICMIISMKVGIVRSQIQGIKGLLFSLVTSFLVLVILKKLASKINKEKLLTSFAPTPLELKELLIRSTRTQKNYQILFTFTVVGFLVLLYLVYGEPTLNSLVLFSLLNGLFSYSGYSLWIENIARKNFINKLEK
ncbi:MAG: hypothetical protein LBV67_05700 [Streptococcaceae bacterium]|nr:hypothetical protein [Streptococcaceae bacterium]